MKEFLLVGKPNSGKTTLFNKLTNLDKKVGNWAGVTVERQQGNCSIAGDNISIIDLPGCNSLITTTETAIDEKITCGSLLNNKDSIVISVVDATQLARDLYLTQQLLERELPVIVAVNHIDSAIKEKININCEKLSGLLNCPVVAVSAKSGYGIKTLIKVMQKEISNPHAENNKDINAPSFLNEFLTNINCSLNKGLILHAVEGDVYLQQKLVNSGINVASIIFDIEQEQKQQLDVLVAIWRHSKINDLLNSVQLKNKLSTTKIKYKLLTNKGEYFDKLALHKVMGIPVFFTIMYIVFAVAMNVGGALQPLFDISTQAIFIDAPRSFLINSNVPAWLQILLVDGVGRGLNVILTFIPVLTCMFGLLSWLEQSGYIIRAAFVIDRVMQFIGLPGKSFVTMVMGFGCNVPAIMGARTIESYQERVLTILMTPFMSCSARLGIYAVFAAAFFHDSAHEIIFSLYLIGMIMAVLTGLVWRSSIFKAGYSTCVMELSAYRWPSLSIIWKQTWSKLKSFLFKAGAIIIPLCMIIGVAGEMKIGKNYETPLEMLGKKITPVFSPFGITEDNWPASVGLLTGMLAKEVVVGTLNSLYVQDPELGKSSYNLPTKEEVAMADKPEKILVFTSEKIINVVSEVKNKLLGLKSSIINNPLSSMLEVNTSEGVLGIIYERFHSKAAAFAYLLFVLIYCPCVSVIATISRELNYRWATFSVFWTTFLAYAIAVSFYQVATFSEHKMSSTIWLLGLAVIFKTIISLLRIAMKPTHSGRVNKDKCKIVPTQVVFTN